VPLRLKVEINSRKHFSVFALGRTPFEVTSRWFGWQTLIATFGIDELLGTKLRALYQRKKGRDLFDLELALARATADPARIVVAFQRYMAAEDSHVTRAMFEQNLHEKLTDPRFTADIAPLLTPGHGWDLEDAAKRVLDVMIITRSCGHPGIDWMFTSVRISPSMGLLGIVETFTDRLGCTYEMQGVLTRPEGG